MHLDFIEIGTADFNTIIEECDSASHGMSIEPITKYLNNLPDKPNVKKINCAIVDDSSITTTKVYYVEESIYKQNFI